MEVEGHVGEVPSKKANVPNIKPQFPVATWKASGLNLRAYINVDGQPQWVYERVHKHLASNSEGGAYLRRNLDSLKGFLKQFSVPDIELGYQKLHHQVSEVEPWPDHTVTSRALLCLVFYQVTHKRNPAESKVAAIKLLQTLVSSLSCLASGPLGLSFEGGDGEFHRVEVGFSAQGVTQDWCQVLHRNAAALEVWKQLQDTPWCNYRVTSTVAASTMQDILFFLCYLLGHPKLMVSTLNPYLSVCKYVLPDLLLWVAGMMDSEARRLSAQPLEELPMLKTVKGSHKRKVDHTNKFILLDKMRKHKSARKRIASTHDSLVPQHSDIVEREAHTVVFLYLQKVFKTFSDKALPRQFAVSWDPSDYGGKNTLVSTVYSVAADCAAFLPNQQIRKLTFADLHDSFIEEAKASKLGTLEGYSEIRALSHALLQATGCSLMDFRVPETLLARPLQDGETRIFFNGAWCIAGPGNVVRPELPPELDISALPALVSCSDQGPSNTASLNFLMYGGERLMIQIQYDCFHRGWNDLKLSAKRSLGYPWKCMLKLVLLFNINYSPFGSGGFFHKKQSVLEQFLSTRTYKDASFQAAIPKICREREKSMNQKLQRKKRRCSGGWPTLAIFKRKVHWLSFSDGCHFLKWLWSGKETYGQQNSYWNLTQEMLTILWGLVQRACQSHWRSHKAQQKIKTNKMPRRR